VETNKSPDRNREFPLWLCVPWAFEVRCPLRRIPPSQDPEGLGSEEDHANRGDQASADRRTQRPLGYTSFEEQYYGKRDSENLQDPQNQSQPGQAQRSPSFEVVFHDKTLRLSQNFFAAQPQKSKRVSRDSACRRPLRPRRPRFWPHTRPRFDTVRSFVLYPQFQIYGYIFRTRCSRGTLARDPPGHLSPLGQACAAWAGGGSRRPSAAFAGAHTVLSLECSRGCGSHSTSQEWPVHLVLTERGLRERPRRLFDGELLRRPSAMSAVNTSS